MSSATNGVLAALFYKQSVLPLGTRLYLPKGAKSCGRFQTKIALAKKILQSLRLPVACKLYVLADSWYWCKELALLCRSYGYHMISQLKSNSIVWVKGKRMPVAQLASRISAFREVSVFLYGKNKRLKIAKFVAVVKGFGLVAVVIVKEKRKKIRYLVSTNFLLPTLEVVKFYSHRWKIEQMIKDLKQRLGLGDYQVRNLQAIQRHVTLVLLSYFTLILLKILRWLKDKKISLDLSIRTLALQVRRHILIEKITLKLKNLKIQFKQNILDIYLEQLCA